MIQVSEEEYEQSRQRMESLERDRKALRSALRGLLEQISSHDDHYAHHPGEVSVRVVVRDHCGRRRPRGAGQRRVADGVVVRRGQPQRVKVMSTNSSIEWTDATWNPVVGCTRVSAGCDNCYAVRQSYRNGEMGHEKYRGLTVLNPRGDRHFNGVVRTVEEALTIPLRRKKPTVYFVNSMSDLFHKDVPFEFVDRVFAVMALCPQHTFQVLTKRPERMAEYLGNFYDRMRIWCDAGMRLGTIVPEHIVKAICAEREDEYPPDDRYGPSRDTLLYEQIDSETDSGTRPLGNVWLGTSVEDQQRADERIPHLLKCPAAVRFLSCEPLLGEIDLADINGALATWRHVDGIDAVNPGGIHWLIDGGESGAGARDYRIAWSISLQRQCAAAGVPYFRKQVGYRPIADDLTHWRCPAESLPDSSGYRLKLRDKKGGDPSEWPPELRVRQMPTAGVPAAGVS